MATKKRERSGYDTDWRRTAAAIYKAPSDGRITGTYEVDARNALAYIEKKRAEGINLTITHLAVAAIGRTFTNNVPEMNCYVKRGRILERDSTGVFVSIEIPHTLEVTGYVVKDADKKSPVDVYNDMEARVQRYKEKREEGSVKTKNFLARIPWPFRRPLFLFMKFILVTLGLNLKAINTSADSYGSVMLSNIGIFGIQYGFAAILPVSNISTVLLMGKVEQKPVVEDGEIIICDIMPLAGSFDHRVIDGGMTGRMALAIEKYLMDPEGMENDSSEQVIIKPEEAIV